MRASHAPLRRWRPRKRPGSGRGAAEAVGPDEVIDESALAQELVEQDADAVMFVYREEYYAEREKPSEENLEKMTEWQQKMDRCSGKAEVIIGKQRHGPIGTVEMAFEGQFIRFTDLAKPWQGQPDRF